MTAHETEEIATRIKTAAHSVSAPMHLRAEITRRRVPKREHSRVRLAVIGGLLAITATVAAFVAPEPPTVQRVAAVALAPATDPPPAGPSYLPGFEAVGSRADTIGGRQAQTVIYRSGTTGINYTVLDGKPLDLPGTRRETVGELELALARDGDVELVAWHRDGKTCILASRRAGADEMVELLRRA